MTQRRGGEGEGTERRPLTLRLWRAGRVGTHVHVPVRVHVRVPVHVPVRVRVHVHVHVHAHVHMSSHGLMWCAPLSTYSECGCSTLRRLDVGDERHRPLPLLWDMSRTGRGRVPDMSACSRPRRSCSSAQSTPLAPLP